MAYTGRRVEDRLATSLADRVQFISGTIAYNTVGAATGVAIGTLPAHAIITSIIVSVTAIFNAETTNVLTVGKAGALGAFVAAAGVSEAAVATTTLTTANGSVGATAVPVLAAYSYTGAAPSTGAARVTILYVVPA